MAAIAESLRTTPEGAVPLAAYLLVDRARDRRLLATARALAEGGARLVELGFPFSDPIADGPTLAAAADRALRHGTGWSQLLHAVRTVREVLPVAVMTYVNPVLRHGGDAACAELARAGASGLILPDLPLSEAGPWRAATRKHGLDLVLLAAPGAAPGHVAEIARRSSGFLYLVSRYGTTGRGVGGGPDELRRMVGEARRARPDLSLLAGFGVRDRASVDRVRRAGADGVIVGTALEERLARGDSAGAIRRWIGTLTRPSTVRTR